jgi:hypothetical protein
MKKPSILMALACAEVHVSFGRTLLALGKNLHLQKFHRPKKRRLHLLAANR